MIKQFIKYLILMVVGVFFFVIVNHAETIRRGYSAIGGEGLFIFSPFIWWIIERFIKDEREK